MAFRALYVLNAHDDSRTATVAFDRALDEYRVRFHDAGPSADYFTNDHDDAVGTARYALERPAVSPVTDCNVIAAYNDALAALRLAALRGTDAEFDAASAKLLTAVGELRRRRRSIPAF